MFGYACGETPGPDAGADLLRARHPALAVRGAACRQDAAAGSRCEEPGDPAICRRQAGAGHQGRRLDPALRSDRAATRCARSCARMSLETLPDGWMCDEEQFSRQPDRPLCDRRPRRRRRRHRPQDHRRYLWRRRAAWRRRVFRQGPDQGRPLGRLCGALSREERRRRRARRALHDPGRLCDRRRQAAVVLCRYRRRGATRQSSPRCCRS